MGSTSEIAAALAAQGVTQGEDRQPLTADRLTALIASVKRQAERKRVKSERRRLRSDAPREDRAVETDRLRVGLAKAKTVGSVAPPESQRAAASLFLSEAKREAEAASQRTKTPDFSGGIWGAHKKSHL